MDISQYQTVTLAAARLGITSGRVRQLCLAGAVAGAVKLKPSLWLIPITYVNPGQPGKPKPLPIPKNGK